MRILVAAAALIELLALRTGQPSPRWTAEVGGLPEPLFMLQAAETMPRLRKICEEESPLPLRRRGMLAPPNFLEFA